VAGCNKKKMPRPGGVQAVAQLKVKVLVFRKPLEQHGYKFKPIGERGTEAI